MEIIEWITRQKWSNGQVQSPLFHHSLVELQIVQGLHNSRKAVGEASKTLVQCQASGVMLLDPSTGIGPTGQDIQWFLVVLFVSQWSLKVSIRS